VTPGEQHAVLPVGRPRGKFATLADSLGVTERQVALGFAAGRGWPSSGAYEARRGPQVAAMVEVRARLLALRARAALLERRG
jgi:hypothetical protein